MCAGHASAWLGPPAVWHEPCPRMSARELMRAERRVGRAACAEQRECTARPARERRARHASPPCQYRQQGGVEQWTAGNGCTRVQRCGGLVRLRVRCARPPTFSGYSGRIDSARFWTGVGPRAETSPHLGTPLARFGISCDGRDTNHYVAIGYYNSWSTVAKPPLLAVFAPSGSACTAQWRKKSDKRTVHRTGYSRWRHRTDTDWSSDHIMMRL